MKVVEEIKEIARYIDEELGDSQKYAKKALCYKMEDSQLAQMYFQLSTEEMDHMNRLHNQVIKLIKKAKEEEVKVADAVEIAYDMLHERLIEWSKEIKVMQNMFRE